MWIRQYSTKAAAEAPTLRGIRNLLNRTSVPNDPKKDVKATEDFLDLIIKCHVVAAASTVMANKGISDLMGVSTSIVKSFVKFNYRETQPGSDLCDDGIMLYACDLLTTGLFWLLFVDAIHEGDGERVMLCWKFLLIIFFSSKRKNYTKEAVILLLQQQTMSPRQAAQLQWSRFINTQGRQGTNKPADLHLEHLNRRLKIVMRNLKGNIKVPTIVKAGNAIGVIQHICEVFEKELGLPKTSGSHHPPSFTKDFESVVDMLNECKVFSLQGSRKHSSYKQQCPLFQSFDHTKFLDWVGPVTKACGVSVQLPTPSPYLCIRVIYRTIMRINYN